MASYVKRCRKAKNLAKKWLKRKNKCFYKIVVQTKDWLSDNGLDEFDSGSNSIAYDLIQSCMLRTFFMHNNPTNPETWVKLHVIASCSIELDNNVDIYVSRWTDHEEHYTFSQYNILQEPPYELEDSMGNIDDTLMDISGIDRIRLTKTSDIMSGKKLNRTLWFTRSTYKKVPNEYYIHISTVKNLKVSGMKVYWKNIFY